ncbi:MAG: hypothetical protein EBR79_00385 [Proteobacteria bacterium]|nr:hypothetical protein [Pseudomonadota bacterium]NBX86318.1 hypothetical protein [Pseudomonadota bacterium]
MPKHHQRELLPSGDFSADAEYWGKLFDNYSRRQEILPNLENFKHLLARLASATKQSPQCSHAEVLHFVAYLQEARAFQAAADAAHQQKTAGNRLRRQRRKQAQANKPR